MGRTTVYNMICSPEKLAKVNPDNLQLENDFLDYLSSIDRSKGTIYVYRHDLHIFWVWNLENNNNKFFVDITKREIAKFQNHCINVWSWSPARIEAVKSALSSLSNYIENMLDDEYEDFRPIIHRIENPAPRAVREKTILTDEQLNGLLSTLVDQQRYDNACLLSLAMNSGRRKSELLRMKASFFTDDNIIYGALYKSPEKIVTKGHGSQGKLLTVYTLSKPFKPYLDLWLEDREKKGITSDWLFPQKERYGEYIDKPISINKLTILANEFSEMLGVPFYWHCLRHYYTTKLSESGIPDSVIQDILGWDSAQMCRTYIDTSVDAKFAKYFSGDSETGIKTVMPTSLSDIE